MPPKVIVDKSIGFRGIRPEPRSRELRRDRGPRNDFRLCTGGSSLESAHARRPEPTPATVSRPSSLVQRGRDHEPRPRHPLRRRLPPAARPIAVVFGHVGLSKIAKSRGQLTGRGMAIAGLVTGYLATVVLAGYAALITHGIKSGMDQVESRMNRSWSPIFPR